MQETINFEIGGQTYKLVGNNKELTELAATLVNEKYNSIKSVSQSANNREIALMLTALNLAEEKVSLSRQNSLEEDAILLEIEKMISFVQEEVNKLHVQ
jgi:cell division protein ZapA (FtsZ GTPase activity inhibitor)